MTVANGLHRKNIAAGRTLTYGARVVFFAYLAGLSLFSYLRPHYNWDLVGYIGAVLKISESDPVRIHEQSYAILKAAVPDSVYTLLTSPADPYRKLMAQDPGRFAYELRFYTIRPLYVSSLALMRALGLPIVPVTVLLSILCVCGSLTVILRWLKYHFDEWVAVAATIFISSSARLPDLARLSTPDALASLLLLGGVYQIVRRHAAWIGYALFWLSLLVRTDCAVFILIFLGFQWYAGISGPSPSRFRLAAFGAVAVCTVALIHFTQRQFIWDTMPYARGMLATIRQLLLNDLFLALPFFVGLNIVTIAAGRRLPGRTSSLVTLCVVALASMCVRILLFPHLADRFFPVEYVLAGVGFVVTMSQVMTQKGKAEVRSPAA